MSFFLTIYTSVPKRKRPLFRAKSSSSPVSLAPWAPTSSSPPERPTSQPQRMLALRTPALTQRVSLTTARTLSTTIAAARRLPASSSSSSFSSPRRLSFNPATTAPAGSRMSHGASGESTVRLFFLSLAPCRGAEGVGALDPRRALTMRVCYGMGQTGPPRPRFGAH
jgi:hypothetical protein